MGFFHSLFKFIAGDFVAEPPPQFRSHGGDGELRDSKEQQPWDCQALVLVWCQFWCSLAHQDAESNSPDLPSSQFLTI